MTECEEYLNYQYYGNKEDVTAINNAFILLKSIMDREYYEPLKRIFDLQNEHWRTNKKYKESIELIEKLTTSMADLTLKQK